MRPPTRYSEDLKREIERTYVEPPGDGSKDLSLEDLAKLYDMPLVTLQSWSYRRNWTSKRNAYKAQHRENPDSPSLWHFQPLVAEEVREALHGEEVTKTIKQVALAAVDHEVNTRVKPALEYIREHLSTFADLRSLGNSLLAIAASQLPADENAARRAGWTPMQVMRAISLSKELLLEVVRYERLTIGLPSKVVVGDISVESDQGRLEHLLEGRSVGELAQALQRLGLEVNDSEVIEAEFEAEDKEDS